VREARERIGERIVVLFDAGDSLRLRRLYHGAPAGNQEELFPPRADAIHDYELSVCIPTHNRSDILMKCLAALNEDFKGFVGEHPHLESGVEVIVIDDGSTDQTLSRLEGMRTRLQYRLVFTTIPNSGPAAARNRAHSLARGRIIIFIDDDKVAERGFLKHHYAFHATHPNVADACLGHVDWPPYLARTFLMDHIVSAFGSQQFGYAAIDLHRKDDLPFDYFVTANVSLKRDWLAFSGGFHENAFRDAMWEDTELGWRLRALGMKLHYVPEALVYHDHYMTLSDFARRQFKIGQYASKLAPYPFMKATGILDAVRGPSSVGDVYARNLDIHDLFALYDCVSRREKELLERCGDVAMHSLYEQLLRAALLAGTRDPTPLSQRDCTAEHLSRCLIDVLLEGSARVSTYALLRDFIANAKRAAAYRRTHGTRALLRKVRSKLRALA
jgi:GT2 family glycosyltransferase